MMSRHVLKSEKQQQHNNNNKMFVVFERSYKIIQLFYSFFFYFWFVFSGFDGELPPYVYFAVIILLK